MKPPATDACSQITAGKRPKIATQSTENRPRCRLCEPLLGHGTNATCYSSRTVRSCLFSDRRLLSKTSGRRTWMHASKKFHNNAPQEKEKATNLELPSSFNGGDHGISLRGDQTTNNKTGLSLNDEDEGCNHQATMPYCSLINKPNILGCGTAFILFLIAVVTVTMKMNAGVDSNSSKQVAVIGGGGEGKELSSVVKESVIDNNGFIFEGNGACVDINGASYDSILFPGINDAAACGEQCLSCPGKRAGKPLRGFSFSFLCVCLLEDGLDFNTTSLCPNAIKTFDGNSGSGPIEAVVPGTGPPGQQEQCWSASEFTLVGNGTCLDDEERPYDFIEIDFSTITSAAACGEQCAICPGKSAAEPLRGFSFNIFSRTCVCLLEDGLDFNTTSLCPNATISSDGNSGSGPIEAAAVGPGSRGQQCWASEVINVNEPTASPSKVPTKSPPVIDGFTFVGDGTCVDGGDRVGMPHDYIEIDFSTITSAEACGEQCAIRPGKRAGVKLRGFNFLEGSYCQCLLEDGLDFNTTSLSLCPNATKTFDDNPGSGPIIEVQTGPPGQQCWNASEVINEPTASPSKDRPKTPTPTMVPTKSPPVIDGFTLVGNGACIDSKGVFYDYIVFSGVEDAAGCGEQCAICPGKSADKPLRGFNFLKESEFCQCLLEDGLEFDTSSCDDATSSSDGNSGSGPIEAVQTGPPDSRFEIECWSASEVINEPTASPSKDQPKPPTPTMVPTKSPPVIDGFTLFGNGACLDGNYLLRLH
eukprot:scaffold2503_cov84-Skeletonema_dohrnii-CCMP3373.AAC.3